MSITLYNTDCLCDYAVQVQCDLSIIGHKLADRLAYEDICISDKLDFILAHIYKQLICDYSIGCVELTDEQIEDMIKFIDKYRKQLSTSTSGCGC